MSAETQMKQRNLGKSNISITPIGLGAWQFSEGQGFNSWFWDPLTKEQTNEIVQLSLDNGINWFDTAEMYGKGKSERGLSNALQHADKKDGDVVIATKWWPMFRFARNIPKTIDERMKNLEPYGIDLYQIHQPWSFSFTSTEMKYMADIADAGHIKSIGVSNFSASKMRHAYEELEKRDYPLVSNQVEYSLLNRSIEEETLEVAKELGITIIAYSPLAQGLLTGKFHDNPQLLDSRPFIRRRLLKRRLEDSRDLVETIQQIAKELDATPGQVALNWLINFHGETVVAIPGASKPKHAVDNAGAMSISLSREQMNTIDEKSREFI